MKQPVLFGSGGGDTSWSSVLVVTAPLNSRVTISGGGEVIVIDGTGSSYAVPIHKKATSYTINAVLEGQTKSATPITTTSTPGELFYAEIKFATIELTVGNDFISANSLVSCQNQAGTKTVTPQYAGTAVSSKLVFHVPDTGKWIFSAAIGTSAPYTTEATVADLDVTTEATLMTLPDGQTVLPVNDIQIWLACAAIVKPYTKLEEVLADEITLIKLMSDSNAVDYLKRSTVWAKQGSVPIMTSATTPKGVVSASSEYSSSYAAWMAFDGDITESSGHAWNSNTATNEWLQYDFEQEVRVCQFKIKPIASYIPEHVILQGSNDNFVSDSHDIYSTTLSNTNIWQEYSFDNDNAYRYYRLLMVDCYGPSNAFYISELQFYTIDGIAENETAMKAIGAYDYAVTELMDDADWRDALGSSEYIEEVLTNQVPILTADSSSVIANPAGASGNPGWKAFDGDDTSAYSALATAGYIGYIFPSDVEILGFSIVELPDSTYIGYEAAHQLVLEYSTDNGSTWNDVGTYNISAARCIGKFSRAATDFKSADRWRVRFIGNDYHSGSSGNAIQVRTLGFLARETGGVQSWLKAAGISKPYTTLDEVIADSETLATLVTDHNAVDYLVTAKGLIGGITSSAKAMRYIGYRNYCADTLLADSDWAEAILFSDYADSVIQTKVPIMTSDNLPEGLAFADSTYPPDSYYYNPYKAFDDVDNSEWISNLRGSASNSVYVGYIFNGTGEEIKTVKIVTDKTYPLSSATYKIQGSNDTTTGSDGTWVDLSDEYTKIPSAVVKLTKNVGVYKAYRLFFVSVATSNSSWGLGRVVDLSFYGDSNIDETKIRVISAVQDTVKDVTSGTATTLCTTDSDGIYDVARTDIPNGNYILESTVAMKPDGDLSTEYFQKKFTVTDDTVEIAVMPENTFYWYGYGDSENLEDVTTANGWSQAAGGYPLAAPTHNTNNIDVSAGNNVKAVALKTPRTDIDLFNYIIEKNFNASATDSKYMIWMIGNKSYGNQDNTAIKTPSDTNGHVKQKSTYSGDRIPWAAGLIVSNAKVYGMYNTKHNAKANFFSAANDIVYYTSGGTDIVVAETNEIGEAVVDLSSIPSGVILKSSIAKDPDNLSNDYTKLYIPPLTERFYMMPDNALYWYGWCGDGLEEVVSDNGWTPYSGNTFARPKYSDNYITIKSNGSSSQSGISSKKPSKGRPRAFVQGVTASSNFYGYLYNRSGKSLNAGGLTNVQLDSSSLKLYSTDDINTDKYGVIQVSSSQEANIYGFWYDVHSNLANFFSAANDRVYYLDNGNPVYVAETNGVGEAWLDLSKIPNGVTLYSSIAKDPDNLNDPFHKQFAIDSNGKFYLMPEDGDKMLYWYGFIGENTENLTAANGWSTSSYVFSAPDYNANSLSCPTSGQNQLRGIGTLNKVSVGTGIHAIYNGISQDSLNRGYFRLQALSNKAWSSSTAIYGEFYNSSGLNKVDLVDSSIIAADCYFLAESQDGMNSDIYALWYE